VQHKYTRNAVGFRHIFVNTLHEDDDKYSLTPWCRVLLEKLTGLQLVKKFPAFQGTRRFITTLTSVRCLSLSWASPIQSIYPHPTSWRFILGWISRRWDVGVIQIIIIIIIII
jgi:hypothetical protein